MANTRSHDVYNIATWGAGFFSENEQGELCATPHGYPEKGQIPFSEILSLIDEQKLTLPVLVRFTDILQQQAARLAQSFTSAIKTCAYKGQYLPVYPVKVNQQHSVVNALLGAPVPMGLEAGSKPELLAVLGLAPGSSGVIVCNGYKDREFIRLSLIGQQLGHRVYIVIEKLSELRLVLEEAANMSVRPKLGIRVRLAAISAGNWQNTGGEKAKFGLTAAQLLTCISELKQADALDCLQLMHFHIGSQVSNIRDIERSLAEAARSYAELRALGAPIDTVDVGGGLSVDYEGTHSRSYCSSNYAWSDYAKRVVRALATVCSAEDLPHPDIITEAGRAMTAHHAVLITDIVDIESQRPPSSQAVTVLTDAQTEQAQAAPAHPDLSTLQQLTEQLTPQNVLEILHDAESHLQHIQADYTQGRVRLAVRAQAEQVAQSLAHKARDLLKPQVRSHRDVLDRLNEKLADKLFCNFSVFQSTPDVWGIDQIFPIIPLKQLNQPTELRAVLQDMTCDSDGRISRYVDGQGIESSLPLPAFNPQDPYHLGIFMVGAYQEILGDMHNLFGDTDAIQVSLTESGELNIDDIAHGDSVSDVLRYVRIDPEHLADSYHKQLQKTSLDKAQCDAYLAQLQQGLQGYTYLEER